EAFGAPVCRIARSVRIVEGQPLVNVPAEAAGEGGLDEPLLEVVVGLAAADLAGQRPAVAVPGALQVESPRSGLGSARVVVVEHEAAGAGVATGDDPAGADGELVDLVRPQGEEVVHRLVVVGEVLADVQAAQVELQGFAGPDLQVGNDAVA